jgi:hypothetical protein
LINGKNFLRISIILFFSSNRYNEVRANAGIDCCIILVGNKSDQRHIRAVLYDDAKRYADERNIQ